jgi:hypothetical protein
MLKSFKMSSHKILMFIFLFYYHMHCIFLKKYLNIFMYRIVFENGVFYVSVSVKYLYTYHNGCFFQFTRYDGWRGPCFSLSQDLNAEVIGHLYFKKMTCQRMLLL